jgi:hypothetical protein
MMAHKPSRFHLPSNRTIAIIFAVSSLLALSFTLYKEFRVPEQVKRVLPFQTESLYVCTPVGGLRLAERKLEIKMGVPERQKADIIMRELKKDNAVPESTSLVDFSTDGDGVIYLNFSHEIKDKTLTAIREITMTYAITNSFLMSFKNMKRVQLLVDGLPTYTLNGAVYTFSQLESKNDLLEE